MTEPNKKLPSTGEVLNSLFSLSAKYNAEAQDLKTGAEFKERTAQMLKAAAEILRTEQEKNRTLQDELNILKTSSAMKTFKGKGKDFTFLIDGSGSMSTGLNSDYSNSPLKEALKNIGAFSQAAGKDFAIALWGPDTVFPISKDMDRKMVERGLNCGTDFAPAIDYMQSIVSTAKKQQCFVVVSDGDLFDRSESSVKAQAFLTACPKATLDFVIMTNMSRNEMESLAKNLQQQFPAQVGIHQVRQGQPINETLANIATSRAPTVKKKSAPKP